MFGHFQYHSTENRIHLHQLHLAGATPQEREKEKNKEEEERRKKETGDGKKGKKETWLNLHRYFQYG